MTQEMMIEFQFSLLLAYAAIGATLVGFIGLVFASEGRTQNSLDSHDKSSVFHFMFAGLTSLFLSLLAGRCSIN